MTTKGFEVTKSETIMYEKGDGIAWITLNRPERMNALGRELGSARARALKDAADDDSILAVIFTGSGGRAFSAGADLKEGRGAVLLRGPPGPAAAAGVQVRRDRVQ